MPHALMEEQNMHVTNHNATNLTVTPPNSTISRMSGEKSNNEAEPGQIERKSYRKPEGRKEDFSDLRLLLFSICEF